MLLVTKKTKGFTLIELLVVIAIIGVLASIVLAALNTARVKSRDAKRVADINQARVALQLYYDSQKGYPYTGGAGGTGLLVPDFIPMWPIDPLTTTAYTYFSAVKDTATGAAGTNVCTNSAAGKCQFFHIGASVEDSTIVAMGSRTKRCPNLAAPCDAVGVYTILSDTPIYGSDIADFNCEGAAPAGQGCYDVTP